ncbi:hypothetical protein HTVC112P_gp02 [Pelagibacter phage HTVC112P]|nr:hypothetical protein HTVC112P_gp02 [Pelagibacter phage HTVC112P]
MNQTQQGQLPFCGLTLKMYSTGKKAPKMEYTASSNKAKFKCTLTKNMYDLKDIGIWLSTPQVQEYVQSGHLLKWGSKIQQGEATQFGDGLELEVTYFMVKPFGKAGYNPQPNMQQPVMQQPQQSYQQAKQGVQLTDDKLPVSPKEEVDWSKENPTDFNPDMYEQELS